MHAAPWTPARSRERSGEELRGGSLMTTGNSIITGGSTKLVPGHVSYDGLETVNIGTGVDLSIRELAETIVEVVGGGLDLQFDASKPDGTPRKLLDVSRLAGLGWRSSIDLRSGIESTYEWYLSQSA